MPFMPNVTRGPAIPASNFANKLATKIGTVTHVIVGSASSAIAEFTTPNSQLSAHFVIAGPGDPHYADGQIIQLLDTNVIAFAQAAGNWPPISYVAKEFGGFPTEPMSAAQLESSARIDAWASVVHGFPLKALVPHGTPGCTTHCNPNGTPDPAWGNHSCPGVIRLGQIPGVVARAQQIVHGTPQPTPNPSGGFVNVPTLSAGSSGLWVRSVQALCRDKFQQTIVIDGGFGPLTTKAIQNVQAFFGVEADGVVGPTTWEILLGL